MHSRNDAGEKKKGAPVMKYIDNIKKWRKASLEENVRLTEDRTALRERSCAAGAANVRNSPAARGGNLAKIPPNQVIADFGRGSSVESEYE